MLAPRFVSIVLALVLVACGDDGPSGTPPDARPPDAGGPPDAEVPDAIDPGPGDRYVVDRIRVPTSAQTTDLYGFDLDSDGTIDNQLGNVLSALVQVSGGSLDLQASVDEAVDRGRILLLARLGPCDPLTCLSTYPGANPQPAPCTDPDNLATCRRHLQGTGVFEIAAGATPNEVAGDVVAGRFDGGPGTLFLQIVVGLTDATEPVGVDLVLARAELIGITSTAIADGKIGGAIPAEQVDGRVIPAVHAQVAAMIAADCTGGGPPTCGCVPDSTGETMMGLFDDNADCTVTLEELRASSLIQTLFRPDVDTGDDGKADALSVGVGITAVSASFP